MPPERILARYPRTLANLSVAVRLADLAILYDSVDVEHGVPLLGAVCMGKRTMLLVPKLPRWMATMLGTA